MRWWRADRCPFWRFCTIGISPACGSALHYCSAFVEHFWRPYILLIPVDILILLKAVSTWWCYTIDGAIDDYDDTVHSISIPDVFDLFTFCWCIFYYGTSTTFWLMMVILRCIVLFGNWRYSGNKLQVAGIVLNYSDCYCFWHFIWNWLFDDTFSFCCDWLFGTFCSFCCSFYSFWWRDDSLEVYYIVLILTTADEYILLSFCPWPGIRLLIWLTAHSFMEGRHFGICWCSVHWCHSTFVRWWYSTDVLFCVVLLWCCWFFLFYYHSGDVTLWPVTLFIVDVDWHLFLIHSSAVMHSVGDVTVLRWVFCHLFRYSVIHSIVFITMMHSDALLIMMPLFSLMVLVMMLFHYQYISFRCSFDLMLMPFVLLLVLILFHCYGGNYIGSDILHSIHYLFYRRYSNYDTIHSTVLLHLLISYHSVLHCWLLFCSTIWYGGFLWAFLPFEYSSLVLMMMFDCCGISRYLLFHWWWLQWRWHCWCIWPVIHSVIGNSLFIDIILFWWWWLVVF